LFSPQNAAKSAWWLDSASRPAGELTVRFPDLLARFKGKGQSPKETERRKGRNATEESGKGRGRAGMIPHVQFLDLPM